RRAAAAVDVGLAVVLDAVLALRGDALERIDVAEGAGAVAARLAALVGPAVRTGRPAAVDVALRAVDGAVVTLVGDAHLGHGVAEHRLAVARAVDARLVE